MIDYPRRVVPVDHIEAVPRRLRAMLGDHVVLDTTRAKYVWETQRYPHYYIPINDIDPAALHDEDAEHRLRRGIARQYGLHAGDTVRASSVQLYPPGSESPVAGLARVDWTGADAWFEEDEQVFVHPRDPYVRVDALRSSRKLRVEIAGTMVAESHSPVMVFETGLPTRYYLNPAEVSRDYLTPSDTQTACPYKGVTSGYWSAELGGRRYPDVAWTYHFPTTALAPIAGLIAFYNEKVDLFLDGARRPAEVSPD